MARGRGGEPYRGSLLTRNKTHASNRAYEHVSFNFIHLIFINFYILFKIKFLTKSCYFIVTA
jgi:hypothetical protein